MGVTSHLESREVLCLEWGDRVSPGSTAAGEVEDKGGSGEC